jgi:hypothetical protein
MGELGLLVDREAIFIVSSGLSIILGLSSAFGVYPLSIVVFS